MNNKRIKLISLLIIATSIWQGHLAYSDRGQFAVQNRKRYKEKEYLRPLAFAQRPTNGDISPRKLRRNVSPPTNEFIHTVLTEKAIGEGLSENQRERIRGMITEFWEYGGWASKTDLMKRLNCSGPTFRKDFAKIDLERLKEASKDIGMSVPLYYQYDSPKRRLLRIVNIVESLGWRASVYEIAKALGLKTAERRIVAIRDVFPVYGSEAKLTDFLADLNYNRSLDNELPLEIFVAKETKEAQDRLIAAFQELHGRAGNEELAARMGVTPATASAFFDKMRGDKGKGLKLLNAKLKAQGMTPIIGIVHGKTRRVENEIIQALEDLWGVGSPTQISLRATGQRDSSVRAILREVDFNRINKGRIKEGKAPLFVVREGRPLYGQRITGMRIPRIPKDIRTAAMELHRDYFGDVARNVFRDITLPFLYTVLNDNTKLQQLHGWKRQQGMIHFIQFVLLTTFEYTEERRLHERARPHGAIFKYDALLDYFSFILPRALNMSRSELADVDLEKLSPMLFMHKGTPPRRRLEPIKPEKEANFKVFLHNVKMATNKLLLERDRENRRRDIELLSAI